MRTTTVLFCPRHPTSWREMESAVRLLAESDEFLPVVVLASDRVGGVAAAASVLGARCVDLRHALPDTDRPVANGGVAWNGSLGLRSLRVAERIQHGLPASLIHAGRYLRYLRRAKQTFARLLEELQPAAVFLPGDRELGFLPPLIAAAAAKEIPRVIIGASWADPDTVLQSRANAWRFRVPGRADGRSDGPLLNRWAARRLPGHVRPTAAGIRLLFSPGWVGLAQRALGMHPERPWVMGGGNSTHLLVDGEETRDAFVAAGCAPGKLETIGNLDLDALHAAYLARRDTRRQLRDRLGIDEARKLVAFAVPLFYESGYATYERQTAAMREVIDCVRAAGGEPLLSFHPKADPGAYRELLAALRPAVIEDALAGFLPATDLFVCGNSLTVKWALLCGIPTVNYDFAEAHFAYFRTVPGVASVTDADALQRQIVAGLAGPAPTTAAMATLFDGRSAERFMQFVRRLRADGKSAARPRHGGAAAATSGPRGVGVEG